VSEVAVFGIADETLGQAIVAVAVADLGAVDRAALLAECRRRLPAYMIPAHIVVRAEALPRNPNGKIDRNLLRTTFQPGQ